jgi:hypothetical protein
MASPRRSFTCPVCGEDVPSQALACPECGACEKSGWNKDATPDALDLPDDDFDYDRFVADEFGTPPGKTSRRARLWFFVALLLVLALIGLLTLGI